MRMVQQFWLMALAIVLLAGCSGLPINGTPKTPAETVYYTWSLYTGVTGATADLLTTQTITLKQAKDIQAQIDPYYTYLKTARDLALAGVTIPSTQMEMVMQVEKILMQIQTDLQAKVNAQKAAQAATVPKVTAPIGGTP